MMSHYQSRRSLEEEEICEFPHLKVVIVDLVNTKAGYLHPVH